ncbi:MAG: cupredoxin domain-containing protein [Acidimicrobiales bacterium]
MSRAAVALAGLFLAGGTLGACGGGDSDVEVPDDVVVIGTDPAAVRALDNSFTPENIQVTVGTEVVWTNRGRNEHNALHVEGDDWGVEVDDFQPGDVYSHTFDEPGVYRYYCSIHGTADAGMIGTVVVTD